MKFNEGLANRLEVPAGKRDVLVFDDELPGFFIRKFESGKASYGVKYNIGRQQRRLTLGAAVPGVLREMRKRASEVLARARIGQDVTAEKRAAAGRSTISLVDGVECYLADRQPKLRPRYFEEIRRQLHSDWRPLHAHTVEGVTRQAIVGVVDEIATRQGEVAADRARMALSGLFSWLIERGHCAANPTLHISPRAQNKARERVLSEEELAEVWCACRDDDYGYIVRLLLLTGQRRREIGDLAWPEIDLSARQIELPASRTKNNRPHLVPLCNEALAILNKIERSEDRDLVFGRGEGGFSGWSRAKAELDERIAAARRQAHVRKPMLPWRLHDLRRSYVTHINERGFAQPHVVEALVNHISGHLAGVAGVYNKAVYLEERREALKRWGAHIFALVARQRATGALSTQS
jgi:integrase